MLNIIGGAFSGLSVVGVVIGFSMHQNRVSPHRERGNRLLAVSSAVLIVLVTAKIVVMSCGTPRPSGSKFLPNDSVLQKNITVGKPNYNLAPAADVKTAE